MNRLTNTSPGSPGHRSSMIPVNRTSPMLRVSMQARGAIDGFGTKLRRTWDERADETGLDEAVTKMIWLAVGIGVAVAASAFFITVFDTAQANVPDPVAPTP